MEYRYDPRHRLVAGVPVADIALDQFDLVGDFCEVLSLARGEVIQDDNVVALVQKEADEV